MNYTLTIETQTDKKTLRARTKYELHRQIISALSKNIKKFKENDFMLKRSLSRKLEKIKSKQFVVIQHKNTIIRIDKN